MKKCMSDILNSQKGEPKLVKRPPVGVKVKGIAAELNAQYEPSKHKKH